MVELFNVGKIVNTQGLKGEIRVIPVTDFPEERFKVDHILYVCGEGDSPIKVKVSSQRKHKNFIILAFADHDSINDVEKYKGALLKVSKDNLQKLPKNEYYYHEIIGLKVQDEGKHDLGEISEILSPGANDVWVVRKSNTKDIYLPYIESVVKEINLEDKLVTVEIPEGLLDDEN